MGDHRVGAGLERSLLCPQRLDSGKPGRGAGHRLPETAEPRRRVFVRHGQRRQREDEAAAVRRPCPTRWSRAVPAGEGACSSGRAGRLAAVLSREIATARRVPPAAARSECRLAFSWTKPSSAARTATRISATPSAIENLESLSPSVEAAVVIGAEAARGGDGRPGRRDRPRGPDPGADAERVTLGLGRARAAPQLGQIRLRLHGRLLELGHVRNGAAVDELVGARGRDASPDLDAHGPRPLAPCPAREVVTARPPKPD